MSEEDLNSNQELKDLANGVKMTQGELNKAFDKNKIKLSKFFEFDQVNRYQKQASSGRRRPPGPDQGLKITIILVDPSVGDDFNHDLHEAVMQVPRANVPDLSPNQIAFIQKTGYVLEDQILRPCWVGVVAE